MATPTLNRARTFASVSGDPFGRCFEQDHLFFTAAGALWVEPEPAPAADAPPASPEATTAEPAVKPKKKGAALAADDQVAAQLGAA